MTVYLGNEYKGYESYKASELIYASYDEPFKGIICNYDKLKDIYKEMVDKEEYSDFDCWFIDMIKMSIFLPVSLPGGVVLTN